MIGARAPRSLAAITLGLALILSFPALAQTPKRLNLARTPPQFEERFNRKRLGALRSVTRPEIRTIVGLQLGRPQGRFDMGAIRIEVPAEASRTNVCVKIASADRRYTSDNPYRMPAGGGTFGLDVPTRYRGELSSSYAASEMIVLAMMSTDCEAPVSAIFLPAWTSGDQTNDILTVFLNTPNERIQARVRDAADRVRATGTCRETADRIVAYTTACELPLRDASGTTITLEVLSRSGRAPLTYAIRIPARRRGDGA